MGVVVNLSRDVPRGEASGRAIGSEKPRRLPSAGAGRERWTSVPGARSRSTMRAETFARTRCARQSTRVPQVFHHFQTPFPSPLASAPAPIVRSFQASISASTSGRQARSERGVVPTPPFHRARSAARSSPRATTSRGTPASDHNPRSSRSRAPSARPRPRTTAKSTSTRSAKLEVGGRRLIPHLDVSRRPTESQAWLTSCQEVEDDALATPRKFPTRSMACPLARHSTAPGHKGPESTSTCDAPSSFF